MFRWMQWLQDALNPSFSLNILHLYICSLSFEPHSPRPSTMICTGIFSASTCCAYRRPTRELYPVQSPSRGAVSLYKYISAMNELFILLFLFEICVILANTVAIGHLKERPVIGLIQQPFALEILDHHRRCQ